MTFHCERGVDNGTISDLGKVLAHYEVLKSKELSAGGNLSQKGLQQLFGVMNAIGMKYAKEGYLDFAQSWLNKSQTYSCANPKLAIILNSNLSCVYKKLKDYDKALLYLRVAEVDIRAMYSEGHGLTTTNGAGKLGDRSYDKLMSECLINQCAILSAMRNHEDALMVIRKAVAITAKLMQPGFSLRDIEPHILAKYNQAVELQHLGRWRESLNSYQQSLRCLQIENGVSKSHLVGRIIEAIDSLRRRLNKCRRLSLVRARKVQADPEAVSRMNPFTSVMIQHCLHDDNGASRKQNFVSIDGSRRKTASVLSNLKYGCREISSALGQNEPALHQPASHQLKSQLQSETCLLFAFASSKTLAPQHNLQLLHLRRLKENSSEAEAHHQKRSVKKVSIVSLADNPILELPYLKKLQPCRSVKRKIGVQLGTR